MSIFRNKPGSKEKSFSRLPLAEYLEFYDVSKNSEHINTFLRGPTQKSPFQIPKFNFLEQKKVNAQNGKVFKLFSITVNEIFYQKSREKDNLIKLIQIF